jgi:hypothetical protein
VLDIALLATNQAYAIIQAFDRLSSDFSSNTHVRLQDDRSVDPSFNSAANPVEPLAFSDLLLQGNEPVVVGSRI